MTEKPSLKLLFSLSYWFGAHSLGLLVHPYQSVRRIVRDQFYRPLIWLPSVCLAFWWLLGAVIARFNILATLRLRFVVEAINTVSFKQYLFSFIFLWGATFLILWQVLLVYLYIRFRNSLGKSHVTR